MQLKYLGHAGFLVESKETILIMDPWLSSEGAFDGGWFQFPCNHHMGQTIIDLLEKNKEKTVFVYVSHEHKDHFDPIFLRKLEPFNFEYILPKYRRSILVDEIKSFSSKKINLCKDGHKVSLGRTDSVVVFTEDSELNRDSAILMTSGTLKFLNLNDCKIHDRLSYIKQTFGEIDILAAQFSGATWHPVCYDYPIDVYQKISRKKKLSKFETTALAIERIMPKVYIPSAGPACFLDPDLIDINFEPENIFPRNQQVIDFLDKRLKSKPLIPNLMPGDYLECSNQEILIKEVATERVSEERFKEYILAYATRYENLFKEIKTGVSEEKFNEFVAQLTLEFEQKLSNFKSKNKIKRSFFIEFKDYKSKYIEVDFQNNKVSSTDKLPKENFYLMQVNAYDIKRVLEKHLTWEDYSLTFRMKLNREPDIYQVLMQGFMILEKEDLNFFCDKILEIENRNERIVVEVGGCKYSIDRYCPHQGADLKYAWSEEDRFLVCPRHRWAFDLQNGGYCENNSASINAIPLETD
jgi:UDP-MurNAc hydroxylase